MAELLVVSQDRPVPDSGGKWREGEVVTIKPDGWEWGRKELDKDKFIVVELPGVDPDTLQEYLEEDHDEEFIILGPTDLPPSYHRRRLVVPDNVMAAGKRGSSNRTKSNRATLRNTRRDRRQRRIDKVDPKPAWQPDGGRSIG